ncbi:serine/threonine protein kinase [Fusarium oxysporum f. sp. melonis 26406]|uniref:Serine/threonine protein kinase n=1 Tax=Fusarium oxysporum f. sp. melonis 26406 TaxID=1089452 RepID=X0AIB6_FUSOX|nr:serine/threonine protein kinase [Fusarium oxysporum f. sp. melonis 26406]
MPQHSEVQRPGTLADDAVQSGGASRTTEENDMAKLLTATNELDQDRKNNPSIVSIFALILRHDVPLIDLPARQGVSDADGSHILKDVYSLGQGASCTVIRHETDWQSTDYCPQGTLVALKKYSLGRSEQERRIIPASKRLHRWIWQELQVFCHPFLRQHENICRLLFVGWEDSSPLPVFGLEYATYGTLADALQHLRSYDSDLRKSHLTVDIVMGLGALHACGFAHGDIKTSNIIIREHSSRSIVAKLSDFTGAGPISTFGQASHYAFGTNIWQPPEVVFRDEGDSLDWQAADIYSLGMVVATIWTYEGYIPVDGTFLDPTMPYNLDDLNDLGDKPKNMLAGIWKHQDDDAPHSLINIAKRMVGDRETAPIPVSTILSHTLSRVPEQRFDAHSLITHDLRTFAQQSGRSLTPLEPHDQILDTYEDDVSYAHGVVTQAGYQQRTRPFKEMFLRNMLQTANEVLDTVNIPKYIDLEYPFDGDDEELHDTLRLIDKYHVMKLLEAKVPAYFQTMANEIYISYLGGCGTRVDEDLGGTWLHHTAATGTGPAIQLFCSLEQSLERPPCLEAPRRLWAAFAALSGVQQSSDYLRDVDSDLYTLATTAYRRHYWGRGSIQIVRIGDYFDTVANAIRADYSVAKKTLPSRPDEPDLKETALHFCAATGNLEFVRFLIMEAGADVNATNLRQETPLFYATRAGNFKIASFLLEHGATVTQISTEGIGILHCLALMDVCDSVILAPLYLSHGASLQAKAEEELGDYTDQLSRGEGLPIMWAAAKKRYQLFSVLLRAHEQYHMSVDDVGELLEFLASLHLGEMLEETLSAVCKVTVSIPGTSGVPDIGYLQPELENLSIETSRASPVTINQPSTLLTRHFLSILLQLASDSVAGSIKRRYLHGRRFRIAKISTLSCLLRRGADPLQIDDADEGASALSAAVYRGDHISLDLFIKHLESSGVDVLSILADCEKFGGYNALVRSIYVDGRENFMFLLDKYPTLKDSVGAQGRTSLHAAATQEWTGYVDKLLDRGVNRYLRSDDGATPFIWAVMRNSSLEVADKLAHGANMDEILGPDPVSGFTAFAKVLDLVASIFKLVVELFPDKVDFIDMTGRTALHYAAWYGNLDAVKALLANNASLNIVATAPQDGSESGITGRTPLDLAVISKRSGPDSRVQQGSREIQKWQQSMHKIIELLYSKGGEPSYPASAAAAFWPGIETGQFPHISVVDSLGMISSGSDPEI